MPDVAMEVNGTVESVAKLAEGMAAKNQTMKDGPPAGGGGGGGRTQTRPTEEQKKAAYDKYKDRIRDIWSKDMSGTDRTLQIGQAVADLAMEAGPDVLKLFGDLLKK